MAPKVSRNERQDPLDDERLDEPVVAKIIGLSLPELQRLRRGGQGLPYLRISPRKVVYNKSDVRTYLQERRQEVQAS